LLQRWKTQSVQGSDQCHVSSYEGSTGSNQLTTQPQRHKEGGQPWVSTSNDRLNREIAVHPDDAHKRRRREEHVLDIWSATTYSREYDSAI